jgi:NAD(P)-dependent dehydrogenase (short-subunit alcohol dehydrogenase family)
MRIQQVREAMPIAVVTGASTGIGQATALALARGGLKVYAAMRNPGAAPPPAKADENLAITPIQMDVDSDASVDGAFAHVFGAEGRIDVLVNNAGIGLGGPVETTNLADFRQIMETNFFGLVRCTKAVIPSMRERRGGCIVNISSVAGRIAMAPQAAYSASKWAVEAFSECLAQEMVSFNVRVALVEPGVIATPALTKGAPPVDDPRYPQRRRIRALFAASLETPVPPSVVADRICEIVAADSPRLRHPSGPDAEPVIAWRRGHSDESWVALGAASDEEYAAELKRTLGLNVTI